MQDMVKELISYLTQWREKGDCPRLTNKEMEVCFLRLQSQPTEKVKINTSKIFLSWELEDNVKSMNILIIITCGQKIYCLNIYSSKKTGA